VKHRLSAGFTFTVELIVVTAVIATVLSQLISTVDQSLKRVDVVAASAEVLDGNKTFLSVFYALKGEWPKDNEELQTSFSIPDWSNRHDSRLVDNVKIRNGAVDITFGPQRKLSGRIITIHPAVPVDDPLGPVKWVVGPRSLTSGWMVVGEDHTTVDNELIPMILKL